jgi:uncharacterized membrane protein YeaQ/YmgE (transglycosylase-associated protein family)
MSLTGLLVMLLIAAVCGALAELIVGFSPGGFFGSAAVGFVGALLGPRIAGWLGLPAVLLVTVDRWRFDVVWAVVGAVIFLGVLTALRRTTYGRGPVP